MQHKQTGRQLMPLIGAKERVTTWKIVIIKRQSGISFCVVIADPLMCAMTQTRGHTQWRNPGCWWRPPRAGRTSVQQAFPLWHQDYFLLEGSSVCLTGEVRVFGDLPVRQRHLRQPGSCVRDQSVDRATVTHRGSAGILPDNPHTDTKSHTLCVIEQIQGLVTY